MFRVGKSSMFLRPQQQVHSNEVVIEGGLSTHLFLHYPKRRRGGGRNHLRIHPSQIVLKAQLKNQQNSTDERDLSETDVIGQYLKKCKAKINVLCLSKFSLQVTLFSTSDGSIGICPCAIIAIFLCSVSYFKTHFLISFPLSLLTDQSYILFSYRA